MGPGTVYSEESTFEGGVVVSCISLPTSPIFQPDRQRWGVDRALFVEQVVKLLINSQNFGIFFAISRSRYMQEREWPILELDAEWRERLLGITPG